MHNEYLSLADIPTGAACAIVKVHGHGSFRNRIVEMGFVRGTRVEVVKNAPLQDPIEYALLSGHLSLRRSEARLVEVVPEKQAEADGLLRERVDTFAEEEIRREADRKSRIINVALVGNPNCGKTSLFNRATGLQEHVGNYSGVTVEAKTGAFHHRGYTINLVDLPGTYSLTEYTPEERYVREYIVERHPDLVLNVVDAMALERNLFLTTQLLDMNIRVVMALNMYDELQRSGNTLDHNYLGRLMGFPVVPTTASRGIGVEELLDRVIEVYEDRSETVRHIHINYGEEVEEAISRIKEEVRKNPDVTDRYTPRYASLKLLEGDAMMEEQFAASPNRQELFEEAAHERERIEKVFREDVRTVVANRKYGFIHGALHETMAEAERDVRKMTTRIDRLLTHRWLGFPFLVFFLWLTFQTTFALGNYPMEWIEAGVGWIGNALTGVLPPGPLADLLVNGIVAGVGGVIVFLPNILILFFFISIMEDTGYMARAAFIMDRLMHRIGLHGKSFIPLLMGFGCNVPAVMATRTLESRRDRIMTMLIVPFVSCSARLPVYLLLVAAFFPNRQGLVLLSVYFIGILAAGLTALLLKGTVFRKVSEPFVMELPPYRMPTLRNTLVHMWSKAVQYLHKMGTVILAASVLIWALGYFPLHREGNPAEQMEQSYIGRIGHAVEPAIRPLGFDWKMGVSLVTGLAAKEIVVSSMGILYQVPDAEENTGGMAEALQRQTGPDGNPVFTPWTAYGFMLFILLYFPCMAVIAAIRKEAGWKWAVFSMVYTTGVAWLAAFGVRLLSLWLA